jgi:hypothetical protein
MDVTAEQCPEAIQRFLAPAECMKCGTKPGSGLAVGIRYQPPMYFVHLTCVQCGERGQATFMGHGPTAAPAPAEPPVERPSWYAHVESGA